jgi:hypothetical protein
MDSTGVSSFLSSGSAVIDRLAPLVFTLGVIPFVNWIQGLKLFVSYQLIELAVWVAIVFALRALFAPSLEVDSTIGYALQFLGVSTAVYGGYRTAKNLNTIRMNGKTP